MNAVKCLQIIGLYHERTTLDMRFWRALSKLTSVFLAYLITETWAFKGTFLCSAECVRMCVCVGVCVSEWVSVCLWCVCMCVCLCVVCVLCVSVCVVCDCVCMCGVWVWVSLTHYPIHLFSHKQIYSSLCVASFIQFCKCTWAVAVMLNVAVMWSNCPAW